MAPSTYNIADLPWNIQDPPALNKERHGLFETVSVISSRRSDDIPPSTVFRGKRIILIAAALSFSAILVLVGAALQIFATNDFTQHENWIITTAPLGSVLAIVFMLSVLLISTVPCVGSLLGYTFAWSWLKASADNGQDRPTPFQLGIIINVLHGMNLPALWSGFKYLHGFGKAKRTSYKPPILRRAVAAVAVTLGLAYTFVALVIALSVSSLSMSFIQLGAYHGTWPQLSRQINSSMCATTSGAIAFGVNLCGLQTATSAYPFASSLPEGLRTLTNNSATNAVASSDDGTAFVIPSSIPEDVAYYGTSNGVLATCQSVTPECVSSSASGSPLALNCPSSTGFNAALNTTTNAYPFGILDASGNMLVPTYMVGSNPFQFGAVVQSQAYASDDDTFVGNTGFFTHGNSAFNVLTCSVTVRSVEYTYFNGSFTVDPANSFTTADVDIVRGIGAMTGASYLVDRVPASIEGVGLASSASADYANAFARELSRQLIALTSILYEPAPPQEVQRVTLVLGSRLSLPILVLLLAWITTYCLFILVLAVAAVRATSASPYTLLAAQRLRSPLAAVHTAHARVEAHRTWEVSPNKLFSVETGLDRLSVGPMLTSAGGLAFGVTRAAVVTSQGTPGA
ncbi:hypothetical protein C8F01DRAFT_1134128 [Mycena amicta]|nr:hypothetical protein C8F01DRAFT_1134128 [Mycena amicta]